MLSFLPLELSLLILDYLASEDLRQAIVCSNEFYTLWKTIEHRVLTLTDDHLTNFLQNEHFRDRIVSLIHDQRKQLIFSLKRNVVHFPFQQGKTLKTTLGIFRQLYSLQPQLEIERLTVPRHEHLSIQELTEIFTYLQEMCERGSLQHLSLRSLDLFALPHQFLARLQSLSLFLCPFVPTFSNTRSASGAGSPSFSQLQKLELHSCHELEDVRSLGYIPDLTISDCMNLQDISALNYNHRITMIDNRKVLDYTKSFAQSRFIKLQFIARRQYQLDFAHWQQVHTLSLAVLLGDISFQGLIDHLPSTIKRCYLSGKFIRGVDLILSPLYPAVPALAIASLTQLELDSNHTLQSVLGMGLDRIPMVTLTAWSRLVSLAGLGGGRNQTVKIKGCDEVRDFSALFQTPTVSIEHCVGFSDARQIAQAGEVTIVAARPIRFLSALGSRLKSFTIGRSMTISEEMAAVPVLVLEECSPGLERFLSEGGRLQNEKVVIEKDAALAQGLYEAYLAADYQMTQEQQKVTLLRRSRPFQSMTTATAPMVAGVLLSFEED